MPIRNPIEWGWDTVRHSLRVEASYTVSRPRTVTDDRIAVHRLDVADLRGALGDGMADFGAGRTDVVFLCIFYPIIGLLLAKLAFGQGVLPILFPLAAGFALLGPLAAVGLNEMSRQRERTGRAVWSDAFGVVRAASPGAILQLGGLIVAIFALWMTVAGVVYEVTLGQSMPASAGEFARELFTTGAGWALIVLGVGDGFLFAVLVLAISIVSFPLLLDQRVSAGTAIRTSVRVMKANPRPIAIWGMIVVAGLVLGSIPLFLGLTVVLPVLGHATWHLYRRAVSIRT